MLPLKAIDAFSIVCTHRMAAAKLVRGKYCILTLPST